MSGLALGGLQACWLVVCKEGCLDGLLNGHGAQLEMDLYGSSKKFEVYTDQRGNKSGRWICDHFIVPQKHSCPSTISSPSSHTPAQSSQNNSIPSSEKSF